MGGSVGPSAETWTFLGPVRHRRIAVVRVRARARLRVPAVAPEPEFQARLQRDPMAEHLTTRGLERRPHTRHHRLGRSRTDVKPSANSALCTNTPENPGRLHGWIGQSFDLAANASQS